MTMWIVAMAMFIVSALLGGINYVTTVLNLRTKGMNMWRMPLTIWAFFITAILGVLSFPVLFSGVLLLMFDRSMDTSFYLSEIVVGGQILDRVGGSPICSTPVLVSGTPGSVYHHPAGHGYCIRSAFCECPETYFWLSRYGAVHSRHCFPFVYRLGAPHVYVRRESIYQ